MDQLPFYIHLANELGITPLNLVLAAMLYFLGAQHGVFPKWWGGETDAPATKSQMERLSNYYNHDTTAILQSIDSGIKDVHKAVGEVHQAVEKLEDSIKELHTHHQEWEKFGIPIRPKK